MSTLARGLKDTLGRVVIRGGVGDNSDELPPLPEEEEDDDN